MMKIHLLMMMVLGWSYVGAQIAKEPPGFDCSGVRKGSVEDIICKDAELSMMDRLMNKLYKMAVDSARDINSAKEFIRANQITWLKRRNQCEDRECIAKKYMERFIAIFDMRDLYESRGFRYVSFFSDLKKAVGCRNRVKEEDLEQSYKEDGIFDLGGYFYFTADCDSDKWKTTEDCLHCGLWEIYFGVGLTSFFWANIGIGKDKIKQLLYSLNLKTGITCDADYRVVERNKFGNRIKLEIERSEECYEKLRKKGFDYIPNGLPKAYTVDFWLRYDEFHTLGNQSDFKSNYLAMENRKKEYESNLIKKRARYNNAYLNHVFEGYLRRGEDQSCGLVIKDSAALKESYGWGANSYILDRCNRYFWGSSESCLYCGIWKEYEEFVWISDRGYLKYIKYDKDPSQSSEAREIYTCGPVRYRVKEVYSPIHLRIEIDPDENGQHCMEAQTLEVKVEFETWRKTIVIAMTKVKGEGEIIQGNPEIFQGDPGGNQGEYMKYYGYYFDKLKK